MTKKEPTETTNSPSFDDLISDLRQDFAAEEVHIASTQFDQPKEGREVKLGHKLPQWAYIAIFATACVVAMFAVFSLAPSEKEVSVAQENGEGITAVSSEDLLLPATFPPPAAPTDVPPPATPTPQPLPDTTDPIVPEPTDWPDPPEPTPIPIPETE